MGVCTVLVNHHDDMVIPAPLARVAARLWLATFSRRSGLHRTLRQLESAHVLRRRAIFGLSRAFAYLLLGGLLGHFVTQRRSLEAKVTRSERLSRDLIATADFDGYFTRLNDSWQRPLGWSSDELCSRPLIDFVHPDDREGTLSELACLADGQDGDRLSQSLPRPRWLLLLA